MRTTIEQTKKHLKFKTREEFEQWLNEHTAYVIQFEDHGQDVQFWWVDTRGEVLHSDMQSRIWNGLMVDIDTIRHGSLLRLMKNGQPAGIFKYKIASVSHMLGGA